MKHTVVFVVLLLSSVPAPSQDPLSAYVGKAGSEFITEEEFVKRFELMPGPNRTQGTHLEEEKLAVLYSIIAEKLLAQEAADRGFDKDSLFLAAFADIEHALLRDALYREEVTGKVHVSEAELAKGLEQSLRQKEVAFRFFARKEDAEFVRRQIASGAEFLRMDVDSLMAAPMDTATVIWSDADPAIEAAAYALKVGEVSPVVEAGTGSYILYLRADRPNPFYVGMQSDVRRERVQERLRLRKEKARLDEYMRELLKGATAYARPEPFKRLAAALTSLFERSAPSGGRKSLALEGSKDLRQRCAGFLSDTLAVAGAASWSVAEIIDRLDATGFGIAEEDVPRTAMKLNNQLLIWVQQEVLSQEAARRGMGSRPTVRHDIEMWRRAFLASVMRREIQRRTSVNGAEVYSHLQSQDRSAAPPRVQLRELRTADIVEMQMALRDLESHGRFDEVVRRWSNDPAARDHAGLTEPFPVTQRPPIGEIASGMRVGEFFGPVKTDEGWLYFQLVKNDRTGGKDTTAAARFTEAARELRAMKERRTLALFVAQAAQRRGFSVYEERLGALRVSPVPLMTFRVLGFGGRLFAVPMVERQIDWLNVEPPSTPVLP